VEQAVDAKLGDALKEAEALLLERFRTVTIADIAADFDRRMPEGRCNIHGDIHAEQSASS
jgi:hypothetical protein